MKNMKKIIFVISIIIVILITFCFLSFKAEGNRKGLQKVSTSQIYDHAKRYMNENIESIKGDFKNTEGLLKNGEIFIGKTTRELENGYFDICISLKQEYLEVLVVKLWKDYASSYMYEDEYIQELSGCILKICKNKYTEENKNNLSKYILNSYLESKKENSNLEDTNIDDIKISSELNNGILIMKIY